jgi:hypothetical protein
MKENGIHLSECEFYLLEVRVLRHDNNDGHILVDEGERTMLEFTGENT